MMLQKHQEPKRDFARERADERRQQSYETALAHHVKDKNTRDMYLVWMEDVYDEMLCLRMDPQSIQNFMQQCIGVIKATYQTDLSEPHRRKLIEQSIWQIGKDARQSMEEPESAEEEEEDVRGVVKEMVQHGRQQMKNASHRVGRSKRSGVKVISRRDLQSS